MPTVLIIDDNAAVGVALDVLFSLHDIAALHAASPEEGLAVLARQPVDLVIQDMNFTADTTSGEEGVALFREIRKRHPDLPVILLTAWTHLDAAVDLVKAGAADYLIGGAVVFWALGILAAYGPAWRAASISPATATCSV